MASAAYNIKMQNRLKLLAKYPEKFNHFQNELELRQAIQYSKGWIKHRQWLVANDIDFEHYPEEIKF